MTEYVKIPVVLCDDGEDAIDPKSVIGSFTLSEEEAERIAALVMAGLRIELRATVGRREGRNVVWKCSFIGVPVRAVEMR